MSDQQKTVNNTLEDYQKALDKLIKNRKNKGANLSEKMLALLGGGGGAAIAALGPAILVGLGGGGLGAKILASIGVVAFGGPLAIAAGAVAGAGLAYGLSKVVRSGGAADEKNDILRGDIEIIIASMRAKAGNTDENEKIIASIQAKAGNTDDEKRASIDSVVETFLENGLITKEFAVDLLTQLSEDKMKPDYVIRILQDTMREKLHNQV